MKKYKIPVYAITTASKAVAEIERDSYEEYLKEYENLKESGNWDGPAVNITNDFELGDSELDIPAKKADLKYYKNEG